MTHSFREGQAMFYLLLNIWLIPLDINFYGDLLLPRKCMFSMIQSNISATCKSQGFFFYLIHSNQIVTAVNKHFEKQAGIPLYLEEN